MKFRAFDARWIKWPGRILLFCLCIYLLVSEVNGYNLDSFTFSDIFTKGYYTFFSFYEDSASHYFNFVRTLIVIASLYVGFLNTIVFMSDNSEEYFHILKFHSGSRNEYNWLRLKMLTYFYVKDISVWVSVLIFYYLLAGEKAAADLLTIPLFLVVNFLLFISVELISSKAVQVMILVGAIFILEPFIFEYIYLFLPLLIIVISVLSMSDLGNYIRGEDL